MASYCFDTVLAKLENADYPKCPVSVPNDHVPLVITWKNLSQEYVESHALPPVGNRGMAGSFLALPLHDALPRYALMSAFEDHRFDPITIEDVPQLHCSVSILTHIQPISDYHDWRLGKHGLHAYYDVGGKRRDAYFLPEVAHEKGWTKQMTVDNLVHNLHLDRSGMPEADRKAAHYERFEIESIQLSYSEYFELKNAARTRHPILR